MRKVLLLAVALSVGLAACVRAAAPEGKTASADGKSAAKPNIVFILADDLGWGDPACYGHPYSKSPAIDRLASEGTSFRQFYVTGCTCCPTRTGFMTGQLPARFQKYPADHGFSGATTITELLAKNGYQTGHFGKWHIGPDESDGTYGIGTVMIEGKADDGRARDAHITDRAIDFIRQHRSEPFYVNVWCHATHFRVDPPESLVKEFASLTVDYKDFAPQMHGHFDRYRKLGGNLDDAMRYYCAEIFGLDQQIGRILQALDELGLRDNTLVVFSSDNGPGECENEAGKRLARQGRLKLNMVGYAGPHRGRKHTFYEGGVREPFIIRWPGHVAAGRVDATSVLSGADWLPTLCKLTGMAPPATRLDGEDVSDIWLGQSRDRSKPLYWKASRARSPIVMREGSWKIMEPARNRGEVELYDLASDPTESRNLASERPELAKTLLAKVQAWNATLPKEYTKSAGDDDK